MVDVLLCAFIQRQVNANYICLIVNYSEWHLLGIFIPHIINNVVTQNLNVKTSQLTCKLFAGMPIANNADCFSTQFLATICFPSPLA